MKDADRTMLDAHIIEEIKRRERDRLQREQARPVVDLPRPPERRDERRYDDEAPGSGGNVVRIDL